MTHQALKISLMEQSKFIKYSLILSIFILISGCQHSWVERSQINLNEIIFGYDIDESFKKKSKNYFIKTSKEKSLNLSITNLTFKKKNFYGGYSARTKQIEIIGELQYRFYDQNINKSGILKISKFMPANEINPSAEIMAQKELISELELSLLEELMQEYWLIEA
jgi:hypothetical protein